MFHRSDQRSVQLNRPSSTKLTKDGEHGSHVVVAHELHPAEPHTLGWVDQRTSILNTIHPLCLCSWVRCWFDLADSSTRRRWHQWESWTDGVVFSRCSKLQVAWCSDQRHSFPWFFLCGFWLWTQRHLFIEVPGRPGPHKLSVKCGPHEKKSCFGLYNLKCP